MSKLAHREDAHTVRSGNGTKYDATQFVLSKAYGNWADLRRELSDSKARVTERNSLLENFSTCNDSQRLWLMLEDYFERLSLSRKDFPGENWWPRMMAAQGKARLEELARLFHRAGRPVPSELLPYSNATRFAELEKVEEEQKILKAMENWLFPPEPVHLDSPRASLHVMCELCVAPEHPALNSLNLQFNLCRPRLGEQIRPLEAIVQLTTRAAHEQELFSPEDWEFIQWLASNYNAHEAPSPLTLSGSDLLEWLSQWGHKGRLEFKHQPMHFEGQMLTLTPHLQNGDSELSFTHQLTTSTGEVFPLEKAHFFAGRPALALVGHTFYLLRNAPPPDLLDYWSRQPAFPVRKLSYRLRTHLRRTQAQNGLDWQELCIMHAASPQFVFELNEDTVRLRLRAVSDRDKSLWNWNGQDWQKDEPSKSEKPEVLEDPRLDAAVQWLRRLDWFTPEPGLWSADAHEDFLNMLALAWPEKPAEAEYLGNAPFHRLFLAPRQLRPRLLVQGSGIDWFSVSSEWEMEGLKLTPADLARLATATGRFVKLPDAGWLELDAKEVEKAHETMADLGLDSLSAIPQKVGMEQGAALDSARLNHFTDSPEAQSLRSKLANFEGIPAVKLPTGLNADLRPYQKEGFDFLCHLTQLKLGGILADDMGLGKTLQTLTWLAWLQEESGDKRKPALVICPASVLHNWRREAEKFTPQLKVLVLESGTARHGLRKQIPQHDLIVTNYALLRRDWEALQKFDFSAVILDEAQFIKNPSAQVTQSVKKLRATQRLALTGTPLENRLLDLWSITDFVHPGYLGSQEHFTQTYEPHGEGEAGQTAQRIARRRLSAKMRPIMLRRLKRQVAQDLPERIEERRDCDLNEDQRKLYLAELRRSRDQVMKAVAEKGLAKSKIHVLAALTRLRQICCHPQLVGNDSPSGKTETLFELLEPLLAEGQKVLIFSQFVQMLKLLEAECVHRQIPIHVLTGETKDRQEVVQAFQNDQCASVFLLSLRAAGTGLNLTTASYVVLYDPWWNPAVEAQAIDRSHRIGQTRTVNAYRLIAPGTVEEKIYDLQQRKAQTIADVLGEEGFTRSLSKTDLEYLFSED